MKARVVVATLTVIAVACTGSASPTTSTNPLPATSTSTSTSLATTTTTTLSFPPYPPFEVEAPGGRWRTTQLSIDTPVVGFAELGGDAYMILRHPDDRVSAHRLADDGWEAVRYEPVAVTNLRGIRLGPMASDGERILLVVNGRERGPTDGPRRRMTVLASTTDGDQYSMVTVPDAWFTDITTDGETWFATGSVYATGQEPSGAIWSSTDGESWVRIFGPRTRDWSPHSIAAGGGRVIAIAGSTVLSKETSGGSWHFPRVAGENDRLTRVLYVQDHFEVHTNVGQGYRSVDGVDWEPFVDAAAPPEATVWGDWFTERGWPVHARDLYGEGAVLIKSGVSMHRTDWRHCYDDPNTCRRAFAAIWLRADGNWSRVELPVPGAIESQDMGYGTLVSEADIVGGRIVLVGVSDLPGVPREDDGYWIWHWVPDDAVSLPPASDPLDTSLPTSDLAPRPGYSPQMEAYFGELEPGVEYAIPLTDWCLRLDQLGVFNEKFWVSDNMPETIPPGWPRRWVQAPYRGGWGGILEGEGVEGYWAFGVAVLVSDDLIEYRIPGIGVVGTFHPGSPEPRCEAGLDPSAPVLTL